MAATPNPFTPDFGRRPALLVGSQDILDDIADSLASGPAHQGYTRLLLGQRGAGKTTLLAEARELAASDGAMVLDADASTPGLLERISSAIADARELYEATARRRPRRSARVSGVSLGPVGVRWEDMPAPQSERSLRHHLESLASWAAEHQSYVLLTVDEMHAGDRDELRRLAADVQAITKVRALPLALVGAGLSEMSHTVLEDKKMTFFHRCLRKSMPPIDFDDAWRCLRLTVKEAGGVVHSDALKLMASAAADSLPYRLQSIGHHAWALSGAPEAEIDTDSASMGVQRADADIAEKIVAPMWHDLSEADQSYLAALAGCGGEALPAEIAKLLRGRSSRSLARSERRLAAAGHVSRTSRATITQAGVLTAEAVIAIAAREAEYGIRAADVPERTARGRRCNVEMPRAKARCVLPRGHSGGHRSRT